MAPNVMPDSPFFAPSTPRRLVQVSTPGGTRRSVKKADPGATEHKCGVAGATSNLVNAIIGAGIVGIPFAIKETGLVAGVVLVLLCAFLTERSLRLLIETAKHVDVPSYEMLFESCYGSAGFYFISVNMFIMAYGGCLSYLTIIKDTLPVLCGVSKDDVGMARAILTVSTMAIILPISMQRDVADLAKTSQVSVLFQCAMVLILVIVSPVSESLERNGGLLNIASQSIIKGDTVFIGLGILSFAYVCQHSAFIVAGSLERPTNKRWGMTTSCALALCAVLEAACGLSGYLAFLDDTEGDILNNFLESGGHEKTAANIARGLLCTTMFFVYPIDSFVYRHVMVVLFFRGRRAHEGDDAAVLNRRDRRVAITLVVYLSCLLPALVVDNVGNVLAVSGTIGASCLAYIGPGLIYLAVHGEDFLEKVDHIWGGGSSPTAIESSRSQDVESAKLLPRPKHGTPVFRKAGLFPSVTWYLLVMPVWCFIAETGKSKLEEFKAEKALKSPHVNRLGKCGRVQLPPTQPMQPAAAQRIGRKGSFDDTPSSLGPKILPYDAIVGGNKAIGAAIVARKNAEKMNAEVENVTDIDVPPTWADYILALFLASFGMVALCAGLVSIIMTG